uniref:Uncharacterized protein n=1 Tax=Amphimedon queenslandica TaxID=400682 RepID=A0A1X7U3Z3_AMPQE
MSITVEQLQFHSNVAFPSMSSSAPVQAEIARTATVSTMQQRLLTTCFLPPLTTSVTTLAAAANTYVPIPAPSLLPAASSYCCTNAWSHFCAKFFFCRGCASPLVYSGRAGSSVTRMHRSMPCRPRVFDSAFSFAGGRLRAGAAYTGSAGCWSCVVPRLLANTRQHLVFEPGKAQQSIEVDASPCKGHSFYIGTATAAAQVELPCLTEYPRISCAVWLAFWSSDNFYHVHLVSLLDIMVNVLLSFVKFFCCIIC